MANHMDRILHAEGTAREIGFAMGRMLGERLEQNIARYIRESGEADSKFSIDWGKLEHGALEWLGTLPQRFQDEFAGMAEGAGLSLERVAQWSFVEQCLLPHCSSSVSVVDGHAWVARNNDSTAPGMWGYVSIREVAGRIPTITLSCEGDIFAPSGINQERLWLHYNALPVVDVLHADEPHKKWHG